MDNKSKVNTKSQKFLSTNSFKLKITLFLCQRIIIFNLKLSNKINYRFKWLTITILFLYIRCNRAVEPINVSELYTLNVIHQSKIEIDWKIEIELQEIKEDTLNSYKGFIKRRGGTSIVFQKNSYEIDLNEDVSIAQLPADDDWILNANYIDKTFLRHVLAYDIFRAMHPNNRAPQTNYIELKLNNVYNGLYVLMEKLDKSVLEINATDTMAMIFKEPPLFIEDYSKILSYNSANFYQQTYPKIEKNDKTIFIEKTRDFILNAPDSIFSNQIGKLFDIQNIIDWHLLLLVSNNGDGILKNFYLYKIDAATPLRIAPWDYDHSLGREGDNELNLVKPLNISRSILFKRLIKLPWYKNKLKERWTTLYNKNLINPKGLIDRIQTKELIVKKVIDRNIAIWPIGRPLLWPLKKFWYFDDNNFDEEMEIIYKFIDIRDEQLRLYFNTL